ncbi:hypothetical protein PSPO01_03490 [Paraphaeosphaeria sporulosa]
MKPSYIFAVFATALSVNALYFRSDSMDTKPAKPTVQLPYHFMQGEPIEVGPVYNEYKTATPAIPAPQTPAPTPFKSEEEKSNANGEYWRNIYDQGLCVMIDANIHIPLTVKMDWSSLTYRDRAEKLLELVAFGGGADPALERDLEAPVESP